MARNSKEDTLIARYREAARKAGYYERRGNRRESDHWFREAQRLDREVERTLYGFNFPRSASVDEYGNIIR